MPSVDQYRVVPSLTLVVVTENTTEFPSSTEYLLGVILYVGTGLSDVSIMRTVSLVAFISPAIEETLNSK